ncbi:DUF4097 family beta strand repeat-containing protein [Actinomadura luteofluorescens]|uniref:DUF4097 family beta strand repeat-containing protein n=1 Tax=Actinomadura luteofluorescens TaxID=46163 RepID=UPI002164D777|nr:DUF4097 family beta strand repeat-containing protein [Actinomadura glauciflava]MCR3745862.1 putative adhesin [Actinomadura glauciflava]
MRTLTATAAAAVTAAALAGCGNVSVGRHEQDRSYSAPAGTAALRIAAHGGRVEITASDSPGIRITERLRWSNEKNRPKARHVSEGSTLALSSSCGRNVMGFATCGVSYRVQVPRGTPVQVDSGDGAIEASGLAGTVRLRSGSGAIRATDLRGATVSISAGDGSVRVTGRAATADLHAGTGSVTAENLTADRLKVRASDGRVEVSGRVAAADLGTGTGSISLDGLAADRLTVRTDDGGITMRLDSPPANVRATAGTGSIRLRLPAGESYAITLSAQGGKRIDPAVHQDSRSARRVDLRTRDGDITVTPK